MSELPVNDDVVTVDGKQYSRLMAEEMARDIELLDSIGPKIWAISDNSSLRIGRSAALSFAVPVKHGYLVSPDALEDGGRELVEQYGQSANSTPHPEFVNVFHDKWTAEALDVLRPGHQAAIRRLAGQTTGIALAWKWHNYARLRDLEEIVGCSLPLPGYHEKLQEYRANEADMVDLSGGSQPGNPEELLPYIADAIEAAHETNTNSWSIYNHKSGLILSISGYSVAFIADQRGDWMLFGSPDEERYASLSSFRTRAFDGLPVFRVMVDERTQLRWIAERFHDPFLQAVRDLAARTKTVTPRTAEFQPQLLETVAKAVGRTMPQPAYVETQGVSPSTPIPDGTLSMQGIIDPRPEAARQMARTILAAHTLSPDCWAVYPTNKRIAVMVGNIAAGGSAVPNKYDFVAERSQLHDSVIKKLEAIPVSKIPENYEALIFPRLPDSTSDEQFEELAVAHEAALAAVINPYQRAVLWQNHKQGLKERIESISGIDLPDPGYLGELPPARLAKITTKDAHPLRALRSSFEASGLHYTKSQIAAFYTALQTKGFVVLSGISGTGKSKIATGFVDMLPDPKSRGAWSLPIDDGRIAIQVRPYMLKHRNVTFPSKYLDRFPGYSSQNSITVDVRIGDTTGTGNLRYELRNGSPSVTLWFHKSLYAAIESQQLDTILVVDLSYSDDQFVNAVDFFPIEEVADIGRLDLDQSNHLFLAVRPDWRDSTSLLGYYNPLTENYEWTEFLKFIIRAGENYAGPAEDRIAWFVILDEMNLAHVEYYFADLLSVIESGRDEKGWTAEPLRLTYPDSLEDEVPPRELFLPPNLYIIGTVNMDETTHAFSPKVLDRAFTIELTDVDFRNYPPSEAALGGEALDDEMKAAMLAAFSRNGKFARIDKREISEFIQRYPVVRDQLQALNDVLRPFRMHFGYRVFDEVTQYLANNEQNEMATFKEAFDQAVFMKVLPKFSGSRARLQAPLQGVLTWAIAPGRTSRDDVSKAVEGLMLYEGGKASEAWEGEAAFPMVAERVRDMLVALERDGFVSFG